MLDGRSDLPYVQVRRYAELLERQVQPWRTGTTLLIVFSALALGVAAIGLYAAFTHAVGQRRREMAVRIAVGASPGRVLRMILGEAARLACVGTVAGTIAALVYAYLVRLLAVSLQTTHAGLVKITPSMEDAARSLGATPAAALARVHVPLLAPSLATAALLVFVDVLKELPATLALRPFNFDTLAVEAYNLAKDERLAEAATPSLAIVVAGLLPLIYVSKRYFQATRS